MVMTARIVQAAMLVIAVLSAVEVAAVRVSVHMPIVVIPARIMHLAVLMVSMPSAIDVTAVRIAMHMTMMMVVLIVILCLLQESLRGLGERARGCRLGHRSHERQRNGATHQRYGLHT